MNWTPKEPEMEFITLFQIDVYLQRNRRTLDMITKSRYSFSEQH